VEIRRESPVLQILTDRGRAVGVRLEDGTHLDAKIVASSVDAHLTFEEFLTREELPDYFSEAVARIDYSSASAKINLALAEPPRFTCLHGDGVGPHHHGTMHIGPSLEYLERAYDDAKYGRPSERPILEMTMATSVDRTIAPPGKHLLSIFVQYAPYKLSDGVGSRNGSQPPALPVVASAAGWDDIKESFADRCIEVLTEYAPNVPNAIEHRQVLSPLDLERTFGITGGNIMQGAMNPHQLFCFRPVAGWADHRTPIRGLYLCGAASHPGGGVLGACGKNAAEEILRDF
jgi:phytoene dehydrogenase-like protein